MSRQSRVQGWELYEFSLQELEAMFSTTRTDTEDALLELEHDESRMCKTAGSVSE
jgi:hypothetical protein